MSAPAEVEVGRAIGARVDRKEDRKLLLGQAQWVDNMRAPDMVYLAIVRSPYAHARITKVDVAPALAHADVVAAWSGADLAEDWLSGLPCAWLPTEDTKHPNHAPLAIEIARHAGDGVAVVAARSRSGAEDAAELVEVDYEPLDAVADAQAALADGAPLVHEEFGTNECYTWKMDAGEVERLFAEADVTVSEHYRQNRLIPNAIEPRAIFVQPLPANGEFTLWSTTQVPHIARITLSGVTGIPESKLRVIAPDVGGGFGSKLNVYPEEALALTISRRLGGPVKWTETRSEGYLSTIHGRDQFQEIELAATAEGKITAVRVRLTVNMGAYLQLVTAGTPLLGAWLYGGCYDIQGYSFECTGVFTHTTPTDAYRGAGRPEATYAIERAVDALARKLGMDPVELRRLNFIREFPNTIAAGLTIDTGDYDASLDRALERAGYEALRAEQAERRARDDPKRLGIGVCTYVEMCGLAPSKILGAIRYSAGGWDTATIRCLPTGTVQALTGTSPARPGARDDVGADRLRPARLRRRTRSRCCTATRPSSRSAWTPTAAAAWPSAASPSTTPPSGSSRRQGGSPRTGSASTRHSCEWAGGSFSGPDGSISLKEIAFHAWTAHDLPDGLEPGLEETYVYDPPNFSWPGGAHIAVVEVDTETGAVELLRYIAVDDVGVVVNPTIVEGQIHGGLAQGVAQALVRGGRLRRGREPADRLDAQLPRAVGRRVPVVGARPHRDREPDEPARREGCGRDGRDRLPGGGDERRRRRPLRRRHHRYLDARHTRASLARTAGGAVMIPAPFDYEVADSVDHAVALLGEREDAKLLAGGHSLIPLLRLRVARPTLLVDLGRVESLSYVRDAGDAIAIGALTRHHDVHTAPLLQEHCPLVSYTAGLIGDPQVRHRGTIGGSLAHGDPASDLPAILLALGGEVDIVGPDGARTVPAADFFRGVFETAAGPQDVVTEIRVPKLTGGSRLELPEVPPPRAGLGDGRSGGRRQAVERRRRRGGDLAGEHGRDAAARGGRRGGARRRRGGPGCASRTRAPSRRATRAAAPTTAGTWPASSSGGPSRRRYEPRPLLAVCVTSSRRPCGRSSRRGSGGCRRRPTRASDRPSRLR